MASRSVLILPDDSPEPILAAIGAAVHSLRVKMFVFSDPALLKAVIDAKKRGVAVKVMLNPARFPLLSLDRIYVRNARVHSPVVLPRRPWSHLSDHAPLVAEIAL